MNFAHAEVATLDPTTMRTLCEEYIANNYIDPETSERLGVKRGLRNPDGTGVLAGLTNVCDVVGYKKDQEGHVIPTPGKLIYRGVNINEIVDEAYRNDRFVFEEVIWLLLFGSLPTREQLDDFCEILAESRALPDGFMDTMNAPSPNIMNKMQRCVLGLYSYDDRAEDHDLFLVRYGRLVFCIVRRIVICTVFCRTYTNRFPALCNTKSGSCLADLFPDYLARSVCSTDQSQTASSGNGRRQMMLRHPCHTALDDRILDS